MILITLNTWFFLKKNKSLIKFDLISLILLIFFVFTAMKTYENRTHHINSNSKPFDFIPWGLNKSAYELQNSIYPSIRRCSDKRINTNSLEPWQYATNMYFGWDNDCRSRSGFISTFLSINLNQFNKYQLI